MFCVWLLFQEIMARLAVERQRKGDQMREQFQAGLQV